VTNAVKAVILGLTVIDTGLNTLSEYSHTTSAIKAKIGKKWDKA
jgi:hypothetical protein